jgi:hypothetical protein
MGAQASMAEQFPATTSWRISTRSADNGCCVEVGFAATHVGVRDSKDRQASSLVVTRAGWGAFVGGVKRGEFDHA